MSKLKFMEDSHQYFLAGVELPSVTQILAPLYDFSMIHPDVLRRAGEFGSNVHRACELYDNGNLDTETLDQALESYLIGWEKFLASMPIAFELIEYMVHSVKYKYAGTLDRFGVIMDKNINAIFDIKTGVYSPATGPQTAAYEQALQEMTGFKSKKRFTVQLMPFDFKLVEHKNKNDFNVFLSCLNIHNFIQNKGR